METLFLAIVTIGAIYYIYKRVIKSGCEGECNCGKK